jgi:hypothetical protein
MIELTQDISAVLHLMEADQVGSGKLCRNLLKNTILLAPESGSPLHGMLEDQRRVSIRRGSASHDVPHRRNRQQGRHVLFAYSVLAGVAVAGAGAGRQ